MEINTPYIVCSAIFYDDGIHREHMPRNIKTGIVACGLRHPNCFAVLYALFPNREYLKKAIQGFLTNENNFVDRKDAAEIALACGQVKELKYLKGKLDSSDLY